MSVHIRPNFQKLSTYNAQPQGTVQGPMVPTTPLTNMQRQQPLYPKVNHGYDALTFNSSDNAYYKYNSGPYNQPCSKNQERTCTGLRENYTLNVPPPHPPAPRPLAVRHSSGPTAWPGWRMWPVR